MWNLRLFYRLKHQKQASGIPLSLKAAQGDSRFSFWQMIVRSEARSKCPICYFSPIMHYLCAAGKAAGCRLPFKLFKPISESLLGKKKNHSISTVIQTHLINKEKQQQRALTRDKLYKTSGKEPPARLLRPCPAANQAPFASAHSVTPEKNQFLKMCRNKDTSRGYFQSCHNGTIQATGKVLKKTKASYTPFPGLML